jgi:DNA-binding GntR family transcriptional regulator
MKLDIGEINKQEAVSVTVYDILKKNILNLNLKPGDRISEQEVSNYLEVSRTPVREAFISLSREGLVYVLPQRGTFISKIDLDQVEESRFIRESLEIAVIELAIDMMPTTVIDMLKKNITQQKKALSNGSYRRMMEYDQEFHKEIFNATQKMRTWQIIEQVSTHYRMTRFLSLMGHISWEKAIYQHEMLLEALQQGNREKALDIIRNHT